MNTRKTNHCCLVCLQIPTLITQNPTDFRVLPLTKTVLGGKGSLGKSLLMPFLTNSFGYLDTPDISTGLQQISKLL